MHVLLSYPIFYRCTAGWKWNRGYVEWTIMIPGDFWHQLKSWIIMDFFCAILSDFTVGKKAGFNFFPCGQISLCPCQTLMSNDIRMSFGLIIDLAIGDLFRVKVMEFSGVRKWHKNVYKMGNFQARELIFCMKRYFLISSTVCYTHFLIFAKKFLADISLKSPKYQNR